MKATPSARRVAALAVAMLALTVAGATARAEGPRPDPASLPDATILASGACKLSATGPHAPCEDTALCQFEGPTGNLITGRCTVVSNQCVCVPVAVIPNSTTTTLASSVNPSFFGEAVTFTATVAVVAPASGTPTGTVFFLDGATTIGSATLNASGHATFTTSALSVGSHSMTAMYDGDTNNLGSTSTVLTEVVGPDNTTTTLTSSVNPSVFGQSVTFTATVAVVSPGAGTPTGTATFVIDGISQAPVTLNASAQATLSISSLAVGSHSLTATYSGDTDDSGSTAPALTQVVNKASTTTALTSSLNPTVFGQSVTFTATVAVVAPGSGTPTGTVTFVIDGISQAPVTLNASAQATLSISSLAVGSHSLTATYSGDTDNSGSTAPAFTQVVNKASTTTALTSSLNPTVFGQSVTFTATVTAVAPGSGTPGGTASFFDGATLLGVVTLNASGEAAFSTSSLTVGSHSITAVYGGDANFTASTSLGLTQVVNQAGTTTTLTGSPNPGQFGQPVTFTATVTAESPGSGTPTGSVTFLDGATLLGAVTVTAAVSPVDGAASPGAVALDGSGQATFTTPSLTIGTHSITATYSGDAGFSTSTSEVLVETVAPPIPLLGTIGLGALALLFAIAGILVMRRTVFSRRRREA
ncbi:MAG: beta strand repeat-containing protein [Thermoanaerobaculales bacterium]